MTTPASTANGVPPHLRSVTPRPSWRRFLTRHGWGIALAIEILAIIFFVELMITGFGLANPEFFPPPSDILDALSRLFDRDLLIKGIAWPPNARETGHVIFSLTNFVIAYLLAAVVGIVFGLALGVFRTFRTMAGPLVWLSYATPRAAIAPVLIMALGFGYESKVAIIFLFAVFPILINVWVGARSVDQSLMRAGKIFGAQRFDLYTKVVLPSILPYLLIGLKLGISRGLIGIVIAEFLGSSGGIGYLTKILVATDFDMAGAMALVFILLLTASISLKILDLVRRRVAPWYTEDSL
jgi:ABC-type nitrate/sulfonate/bicarbonate transport system permease component